MYHHINRKNPQISWAFQGHGQFFIALIFSGTIDTPSFEAWNPRQVFDIVSEKLALSPLEKLCMLLFILRVGQDIIKENKYKIVCSQPIFFNNLLYFYFFFLGPAFKGKNINLSRHINENSYNTSLRNLNNTLKIGSISSMNDVDPCIGINFLFPKKTIRYFFFCLLKNL